MNSVFEKIIVKLEERRMLHADLAQSDKLTEQEREVQSRFCGCFCKAKEIVKQEAEQYNNGWIPCSSGILPKRSNSYCVTKMCENDGNPIYETCHEIFWINDNKWDCERDEDCEWRVIAWKEKDKPYHPNGE